MINVSANHPGLTIAEYADAVRARARGEGEVAWALEEAAFDQPHYTPVDFACRGLARLRHGDWRGWLDYEARFSDPRHRAQHARPFMYTHEPWHRFSCDASGNWHERPGWEAELKELTILVGQEGGAGDMIMLSRFLPWLARRAKRVYWLVPLDMLRLRELVDFEVDVIAQEELPPFDRYVMMFSLPAIVGEMLPAGDMYNPFSYHYVTRPLVNGGSIGLCWAGNPQYGNNDARSMAQSDWLRLLIELGQAMPGARFLSYQRGPAAPFWPREQKAAERVTGDWSDTYRSLAMECRTLVTVDTGIAHLAGAMNIPTMILLGAEHCWRWTPPGAGENDILAVRFEQGLRLVGRCAWYPSVTLVQQPLPGLWQWPIEEAARLLKAEMG